MITLFKLDLNITCHLKVWDFPTKTDKKKQTTSPDNLIKLWMTIEWRFLKWLLWGWRAKHLRNLGSEGEEKPVTYSDNRIITCFCISRSKRVCSSVCEGKAQDLRGPMSECFVCWRSLLQLMRLGVFLWWSLGPLGHEAEPELILEVLMILGKSHLAHESDAGQEFSISQHTCSFLPITWL